MLGKDWTSLKRQELRLAQVLCFSREAFEANLGCF